MATKKTTSTRKPATKKTPAKKSVTRKPATRRPDQNLPPTANLINSLTEDVLSIISEIDNYAANLRALDRARHNGVGIKRLGFIEAALRLSTKFPQYFPHWLTTAKFKTDLNLFNAVRSLVEVCRSLEEKAWNINIEASDMVYTDALEYYSQVQDAAQRRIDSAESIYKELFEFFRHEARETDQPTQKKAKKDFNAVLKGTKDGEVIVKNIKPKTTAGKREIIDETFKDSAQFKETDEGSINE